MTYNQVSYRLYVSNSTPHRGSSASCPPQSSLPPSSKHENISNKSQSQVHKLCQEAAPRILADFQPELIIAIGGGGYVPARILRSFLKQPGSPNIPIQAIGLSLYELLPSKHPSGSNTPGEVEVPGTKVTRTQWLDLTSLGEVCFFFGSLRSRERGRKGKTANFLVK